MDSEVTMLRQSQFDYNANTYETKKLKKNIEKKQEMNSRLKVKILNKIVKYYIYYSFLPDFDEQLKLFFREKF